MSINKFSKTKKNYLGTQRRKKHWRILRFLKKMRIFPSIRKHNFFRSIKTVIRRPTTEQLNRCVPIKMLKPLVPNISIPSELEVILHEDSRIAYNPEQAFHRLPLQEIIRYKGKIKLSVPQMNLEVQQLPRLVCEHLKDLYKANLWLYMGQRQTDWHYDGHDNFLYMLRGKKVIYLCPPQNLASKSAFSLFSNHKAEKSPISNRKTYKAQIRQNQCIYIPRGWWHRVYSFGQPSIAVNYWGNSLQNLLSSLTTSDKSILLKQLLYEQAEKKLSIHPYWNNLSELEKESLRRAQFEKLLLDKHL